MASTTTSDPATEYSAEDRAEWRKYEAAELRAFLIGKLDEAISAGNEVRVTTITHVPEPRVYGDIETTYVLDRYTDREADGCLERGINRDRPQGNR